ncbi:MAG: hypothetical protein ACLP36_13530 [Acidimicrobiales bacterium]
MSSPRREIDRRSALKLIGGAAAGAVVGPRMLATPAPSSSYALVATRPYLPHARSLPEALRAALTDSATPSLAFQAIRTTDMVYLGFEFYNAKAVVTAGQTEIVAENTKLPMYMVVVFPSQHLGEECVAYTPGATTWPTTPMRGALAGFSWLAFELPGTARVPYTMAGLLDWSKATPELVPVATSSSGLPAAPDPLHTALEIPWQLWLTPLEHGTWHHSVSPVTFNKLTELWHTRLGAGAFEPPAVTPHLKAFWAPGYPGTALAALPGDPWLMSLLPENRLDIVTLTTGRSAGDAPLDVDLLLLSALGASVNIQGSWNPGPNSPVDLSAWWHRASIGRDSYVRVVITGYLFPWGNRASRIIISDREIQVNANGEAVAYLVQKQYIAVKQPQITYAGDPDEPDGGRGNPIRSLLVKTVTTPPIDFDHKADMAIQVPTSTPGTYYSTDDVLWVRSGGEDVAFSFVGTDTEGRDVDFTTGVIWVSSTFVQGLADMKQVATAYRAAAASRRSPSFGGSLFAFADTVGGTPGSTAQHVNTYGLTAFVAENQRGNFYPGLDSATVRLPGAEQIVGAGATPLPSPSVSIHSNYLSHGFQSGVTEVYLQVMQNAPGLSFPPNLVGGMATPNFDVSGIARDLGPVGGDLDDLLAGKFDPSKYFNMLSGDMGKLLGAISVADIILPADPDEATANGQAPQISDKIIYPDDDDTKPPTALDVKIDWTPTVTGDTPGFFRPQDGSGLTIHAEIYTPIANPSQTTYSIHGDLTNFQLVLFGKAAPYIAITFNSFTFDSKTGAKTSIQPDIDSVEFKGPLTFINALESLLSSLGGPSISVTDGGVNASYSLALPDVGVGVFSLQNLALSAGVNIPFDGTPVRVRFGLSSRDNPFILAIDLFGGGGFFSLGIGADGIELIEVSLEFGADLSIDLGVASGGVSIMAGIYFSLQTVPTKQVQLTGFLRADGNLSVLGIISISMEFYLGLTYLDPGKAYGTATVSVSVSVLFVSVSVGVTMQKTIGGSGDPDFKETLTERNWTTYCEAFA